ncbi:MAG: cysteine-rich outer membrane protein [Candidatus Coproplasma sp.]
MALNLSSGETIIRDWKYAVDSTNEGNVENSLIITNKRLIATNTSPQTISRTEIPLDAIKSISSSYSSKKIEEPSSKIPLIVVGSIFIVIAIVIIIFQLQSNPNPVFLTIGAILGIIGICMLIAGLLQKKSFSASASFSLVINTYGQEGKSLSIGKKAGENLSQTIEINTVAINENDIKDIIDTIGAIAINKIAPENTEVSQ